MPVLNYTVMKLKKIVLGGGCFWCIEAVFRQLKGIVNIQSGYINGHLKNPSYKEVCTGTTGHNEVVSIEYDSEIIQLQDLLLVFWTAHNPTTLNQQGADKGTQYRSGIYYYDSEDLAIIQDSVQHVATKIWTNPIVTEIEQAETFYPCEAYHDDYFALNSSANYCQIVIAPKVQKVKQSFQHLLK